MKKLMRAAVAALLFTWLACAQSTTPNYSIPYTPPTPGGAYDPKDLGKSFHDAMFVIDSALHTLSPSGGGTGTIDLGPFGKCYGSGGTYNELPAWNGDFAFTCVNDLLYVTQWGTGNSAVLYRPFIVPSDYNSSGAATATFYFAPDSAAATGNFEFNVKVACGGTQNLATAWTFNAAANTGAVAVSGTRYQLQTATTGTISMTGCTPGALAEIAVQRNTGVASNSTATVDLAYVQLNYPR